MQEMQVQSLGQEDPLKEKMAMHFSILALEIASDTILHASTHTQLMESLYKHHPKDILTS